MKGLVSSSLSRQITSNMINFSKIYNQYIKIQRMMILLLFFWDWTFHNSRENKMKLELEKRTITKQRNE